MSRESKYVRTGETGIKNKQCRECKQYCPPSQIVECRVWREGAEIEYICRGCLARLGGNVSDMQQKDL